MPTRSERFALPVWAGSPAAAVVFTVPDGATALVKQVRLVNTTAGPVVVSVSQPPHTAVGLLVPAFTLPALSVLLDRSWFVLHEADELRAQADVAEAVAVTAWGAMLPE